MRVRIVGAGFSGLTLAYFLTKEGVPCEVFEATSRIGGFLQTQKTPWGLIEPAANGVLNTRLFETLCEDLGIVLAKRRSNARRRYVYRGHPRRWPLTVLETLGFAIRFVSAWLRGQKSPRSGETVSAWGHRVGGRPFTEWLLVPALQGIYAGDPDRLSAGLLLGPWMERKSGGESAQPRLRGTVAPQKGMYEIIAALERWLESAGVSIHKVTELTAEQVAKSEQPIVLATSGWRASELCPQLPTPETLPLVSVTLFYEGPAPLAGFGCLFPRGEGFQSLGVLMNSEIFEGRSQVGTHSETWILGGATDRNLIECDDEEILRRVVEDRRHLNPKSLSTEIKHHRITRWPRALPHYTVEWENKLSTVHRPPHLYWTGNFLGGIGLSRILERNRNLAKEIKDNET